MSEEKKSILIIDDEKDVRLLLIEAFESGDFLVLSAKSIVDSLPLLDSGVDAIICDFILNDGQQGDLIFDAVKKIPVEKRPIFYFISGKIEDLSEQSKYIAAGAKGFFSKTCVDDLTNLVEIIKGQIREKIMNPEKSKVSKLEKEEVAALGLKILLVDDEPDIVDLLKEEFSSYGHETMVAYSGNEAIELLKNNEFHAVFADYKMPNGDGMSILEEIKNSPEGSSVPMFFFCSGQAGVSVNESLAAGACAFYQKPLDMDHLISDVTTKIKQNPLRKLKERTTGEVNEFKILIVDDEQEILDLLVEEFSLAGFLTEVARNGQEAIAKLDQNFDAIFADYRMPQGGGMSILEQIKRTPVGMQIPVFIFGSGQIDIGKDDSLNAGASAFYSKPFILSDLVKEVSETIIKEMRRRGYLASEDKEEAGAQVPIPEYQEVPIASKGPLSKRTSEEYEKNLLALKKRREVLLSREQDLILAEEKLLQEEEDLLVNIKNQRIALTKKLREVVLEEGQVADSEEQLMQSEIELLKISEDTDSSEITFKEQQIIKKHQELQQKEQALAQKEEELKAKEQEILQKEQTLKSAGE